MNNMIEESDSDSETKHNNIDLFFCGIRNKR